MDGDTLALLQAARAALEDLDDLSASYRSDRRPVPAWLQARRIALRAALKPFRGA